MRNITEMDLKLIQLFNDGKEAEAYELIAYLLPPIVHAEIGNHYAWIKYQDRPDIIQECFLETMKLLKKTKFDPSKANFSTFVTRYVCVQIPRMAEKYNYRYFSKKDSLKICFVELDSEKSSSTSSISSFEEDFEQQDLLSFCLSKLTNNEREILIHYYGLNGHEALNDTTKVAKCLNKNSSTLRVTKSKAEKKLKNIYCSTLCA